MIVAASLALIAAAVVPQAAGNAPQAATASPAPSHGVQVASATAQAVILRPATIDFAQASATPSGQAQSGTQVYRQVTRQGGQVAIAFN